MRIGHYMHGLWSPGGIATYLRRVSAAQEQRGHDVLFFDSSPGANGDAFPVRDGTDLVAAAIRSRLDVLHLHADPPQGLPGGLPAVRTVHGHQPYCPSGSQYLALRSAPCERRHGLLACTWGHAVDRCGSLRPHQLIDDFRRTRAEHRSARVTLLLAISEFVRGRLVREGYDPARIRVLPNPGPEVGSLTRPPATGVPQFLFIGRVVRLKGLLPLVEAMAVTKNDCVLDVAGAGPGRTKVQSVIDALGLRSRVTLHGWVDSEEVATLISRATAVVVPSLWQEPAGLVAIEAAVHGRATVASAVGGLPEIVVDGVTGLLVAPGDVRGLAAALDRLAANPADAAAMGAEARTRGASLYSLDGHIDRLLESYAAASASFPPN